jgi:4-amino-4-deoxy-L-arabinose transferase-like glycosyltransferase
MLLSILIFLAIALPWFIYVLGNTPGAMQLWKTEVFREGATSLERDPFYSYVSLFGVMAPWVAFFIAGAIGWLLSPRTNRARSAAVMFTFVPVIIMSCFKDKNERYLVPMVVPAAILAATAIAPLFRRRELWNRAERALFIIQCIIIGGMAIGLPMLGTMSKNGFGGKWWSPTTAAIFAAILIPLAIAAIVLARKQTAALVGGTMLLMLAAHAMFLEGYRQTTQGRSEIKPLVDRLRELTPTAQIYYTEHRDPPRPPPADLQIYANRIVRAISNTARPNSKDHVIIYYQRDGEPLPVIPGYRQIASRDAGKRAWHAFVGK